MFNWLIKIFKDWKRKKEYKKRLEELRKKDPFLYK